MIDVTIISSSSSGNAITVSDGKSTLLLDAGLSYKKLSRAVRLSEIEAVLISHEHMDHCKASPELIRRGVEVYMSLGTGESLSLAGFRRAESLRQIETDNWRILPFSVEHDAQEPLGYLIQSKNTGEKAVYAIDTATIDYDFTGVHSWLLGCNYSEALLETSDYNERLKDRIRHSHMSIESAKVFLSSSDLSKTEAIYLLHLSDANSDEQEFIREIEQLTGIPVYTETQKKTA